jgi:hypothetical protein
MPVLLLHLGHEEHLETPSITSHSQLAGRSFCAERLSARLLGPAAIVSKRYGYN